ncbi:MAG: hypothetical protein ACREL5_06730 [Gemmatimonadales bacterium]
MRCMRCALVALLSLITVRAAPAQGNAQCNSYGAGLLGSSQAANICNAAVDGASLFAPVAGVLISGGSPFLGATGGLGGFPHLGVTLRVNATNVVIPDVSYDGNGTEVGARKSILAPAPLIEGALGVFRGIGNGILAVDALGSAQLLPTRLISDVHIDVNARRIGSIALGLGYGARVTLLGETRFRPAITVSLMRRTLPRVGVGDVLAGDRYSFASNLASTDWRATVGKRFGAADLGLGAGWTGYHADASIEFVHPVTGVREPPIDFTVRDSRAMAFADAGLAAGRFYLIGEIGLQRGKDLHLGTTFDRNDPAQNRVFGGVGLRIGI